MTASDALIPALNTWQPSGPGPHSHSTQLPGWQATVTAEANDSLATKCQEVILKRTAPAPAGSTLRGWADGLVANPAGLPEPLALHEIDTDGGVAILRSAQPTRRGDTVGYYEATLAGTEEAKLRRYTSNTADRTPREAVPFVLTHESIGKIAETFAE